VFAERGALKGTRGKNSESRPEIKPTESLQRTHPKELSPLLFEKVFLKDLWEKEGKYVGGGGHPSTKKKKRGNF